MIDAIWEFLGMVGESFERTDRLTIVMVAFIVGSLLSWFAAREWFSIAEIDDDDELEELNTINAD